MKNQLNIYHISKSYGKKLILDNLSMQLSQAEIVGLLGRNGCGKSTLLKIIFGTVTAPSFHIAINTKAVKPRDIIPEQHIAYLPQDPFLPEHLKVRQVIPLFYQAGEDQDLIFRAPFIEKMAAQKVGTLSLGERRYLELLLIANLPHPFLFLDEPFSMIEPLFKEEIKRFLLSLKAKKGILITDHYYQDVLDITDRNLVLHNGSLQSASTVTDLKNAGYLK